MAPKALRSSAEVFRPFSGNNQHPYQQDSYRIETSTGMNLDQYFSSCNLSPIGGSSPSVTLHHQGHDLFDRDPYIRYSQQYDRPYYSDQLSIECFTPRTGSINISSMTALPVSSSLSIREELLWRGMYELGCDCTGDLSMGIADPRSPPQSPHCSPELSGGTPLGSEEVDDEPWDYCAENDDDDDCFDILKEAVDRSTDSAFDEDSMGLTVPVRWTSHDCSDSFETAVHHTIALLPTITPHHR